METRRPAAVLSHPEREGRIRVVPMTAADRRWQEQGRPHFLNRATFERHMGVSKRSSGDWLTGRTLTIAPLVDLLLAVTLLVLPFVCLWRLTAWVCPPLTAAFAWLGRSVLRSLSQLIRLLRRWVYRNWWQAPVRRLGVAVTIWFWMVGIFVVMAGLLLLTGHFLELLVLMPLLVLVIGWWQLLRWWRQRIYRPRPLPARRRRL